MKLHILSEHLQKKLPFLNHALSSRTQLPILSHIALEAKDGSLLLQTTDLEIGIQVRIPAHIEEEGATTVPAKLFSELIASLPHEKITLAVAEKKLTVSSKKTKTTLQMIAKDEFPTLYEEEGEKIAVFATEKIQRDLEMVTFAASLDSARPALSGILIKMLQTLAKNTILFVATDGYRLSLIHHSAKQRVEENEEGANVLLVPSRVFKELLQMKDSEETVMYVSKQNNQVVFTQKDTVLVGRLIEAEFPPYERIIPSEFTTKVAVDREELFKAVKMCAIFARETANIIKLTVKKDGVVVSANTPSVGDNQVTVEASVDGDEGEIAFNAKYLLDMCSNIKAEDIVIEMNGALQPGVFKLKGDSSFLHIIMPIRIQG